MINYIMLATPLEITFTLLLFVGMIGVSVLLFFSIRKEYRKITEKSDKKEILNTKEFESIVDKWILSIKRKANCYIVQVDIREYAALVKAIGIEQYEIIFQQMLKDLFNIQPFGVRVCKLSKDKIYLLIRSGGCYDSNKLCELILNSVGRSYEVGEMNIDVKVNLAIVTAPQDGTEISSLKKLLDITMIMSRRKGVNQYECYTLTFANESSQEYIYYQEIKEAIRVREFNLFYQAVVDSENMEVIQAETLMRWLHKTRGVLRPSEFLNIMEQTGDINWVGQWCFEQMIIQHNAWKKKYEQKFAISYNLSERQVSNPQMPELFIKILKKYKGNPEDYSFEVDERVIFSTSNIIRENLSRLASEGFKICFEGFGKKVISPRSLTEIDVDIIKIDRAFWSEALKDDLIKQMFKLLVEHGVTEKILLVATGVEIPSDVVDLRQLGIRYMQGYLFDKPKDGKDFIGNVLLTPWEESLKMLVNSQTNFDLPKSKNKLTIEEKK